MERCNKSAECGMSHKCDHGILHDCDEAKEPIDCDTWGAEIICETVIEEVEKSHLGIVMLSRLRREIQKVNENEHYFIGEKKMVLKHLNKIISGISCEEISGA